MQALVSVMTVTGYLVNKSIHGQSTHG